MAKVDHFATAQAEATRYLKRITLLNARCGAGKVHATVPARFADPTATLEKAVARDLPESQVRMSSSSRSRSTA